MTKHFRNMMWSLAWLWLVVLFCNVAQAAAPDWPVINYPNYTGVLARVKINGVPLHAPGSLLAAFYGDETTPRGVAEILGVDPDDDIDGEYYFSLAFGSNQSGEKGFTFKLWNSADDTIYDIDKTLDFDTNYPAKPEIYGGFTAAGFVPCIMNAIVPLPVVTVSATDATATEPATNTTASDKGTFRISRTGSTTSALTVYFTVSGTATSGTDYTSIGTSATITAGSSYVDVTVTPKYDTSSESNETVILTLASRTTYDLGTPNTATVTIVNTPIYTITATYGTASPSVAAAGATITVTANAPATGKRFSTWTSSDVTFASATSSTTTFTMPAKNVTVTANYVDDLSVVTVSATDATATEPATNTTASDKGTFRISRTAPTTAALTVYFSVSGTATSGTDYTSIGTSATIPAGSTYVDVTVTPKYDTTNENDETVILTLISKTTYTLGTPKTATVTIKNTPIKYSITVANGTADKSQAAAGETVTITANAPATGKVFDKWTSSDVTFANATSSTTTFTMPSKNVTVTATYVDDDPNRKYNITVNGGTADKTKAAAGEIVTITAAPPASTQGLKIWSASDGVEFVGSILGPTTTFRMPAKDVTLTASFVAKSSMPAVAVRSTTNDGDETAQEPSSATGTADKGKFTFTRTTSSGALTVYFDIRGTATKGTDYKSITSSITFASGKTSVEREIEPLFDGATEGDETVQVVLKPATGTQTYRGGAVTDATVTIKDSEPPKPKLTVSGGKINGTSSSTGYFDPGEVVTITATLPSNQGLKIWTANKDVTFIGSVLASTTTIVMPDEDVTVTASFIAKSSMPAVSVKSNANTGDDTAAEPSSATGTADKGKFTFTRTMPTGLTGALTVYFDIRGTAENGTDYKQISSSVTFASGASSVECEIEPLFDGAAEGDETVEVVLIPATGTQTYRGGTVTDATVTIKNTDPIAEKPVVTVTAPDATATKPSSSESTGTDTGTFRITRTGNTTASLVVYYSVGGTASAAASYFDIGDYLSIGTSVTIPAGSDYVDIQVTPITTSNLITGTPSSETVIMTLSANEAYSIGTPKTATVTIKPYNSGKTVTITATDATATEPSSSTAAVTDTGTFRITRTGATTASLVVYYSVGGTAASGTDYTPIGTSATIPAGRTSVDITVMPKFDTDNEGNETVVVTLTSKTTYELGTPKTATVTIKDYPDNDDPFHPADCRTQDHFISGLEFLDYASPVKAAALGNYEYAWDGADVLSFGPKATRGDAVQTRGDGEFAVTRTVSSAMFMAGTTVEVTLGFGGTDRMTSLFVGERIPEGWTVLGDAAGSVVNGVLRVMWDSPDIPASFTYVIQAPTANLAASYVISSNSEDTACFVDYESHTIVVEDTVLTNNHHPADCVTKDGKISGLEYLKYAGPVKALALANEEYTWDGSDVLSIRPKNATRGGADVDVAIMRSVDTSAYETGNEIIVTLTISGADSMVSLFVGEKIPDGWSVAGDYAANVRNNVLRMTWDAPNIPETVTYILQAPAENLSASCKISSSSADTGCFTDRVLFLDAGETVLVNGSLPKPAEWPQDMALYSPADGKNYRESDNLAVTFSWPAILNAESYRLVVAAYDGTVVFDGTVDETAVTVRGLERGSYAWNITAVGDGCVAGTSEDFRFAVASAVPVPIIVDAVADGTAVRLAFDTNDAGYTDGTFTYQIVFYSLETRTLTSLERTAAVANGRAAIDLGVAASNGYLYIRPVTSPESDFTELVVK